MPWMGWTFSFLRAACSFLSSAPELRTTFLTLRRGVPLPLGEVSMCINEAYVWKRRNAKSDRNAIPAESQTAVAWGAWEFDPRESVWESRNAIENQFRGKDLTEYTYPRVREKEIVSYRISCTGMEHMKTSIEMIAMKLPNHGIAAPAHGYHLSSSLQKDIPMRALADMAWSLANFAWSMMKVGRGPGGRLAGGSRLRKSGRISWKESRKKFFNCFPGGSFRVAYR